jgi:hypothetical protein
LDVEQVVEEGVLEGVLAQGDAVVLESFILGGWQRAYVHLIAVSERDDARLRA